MLQVGIDWLFYSLLGLDQGSRLVQSLNFFVYDSLKIIVLLFALISIVGFLRTFLPQHRVKAWLTKNKTFGYLGASLFGALTPFCSCSSIPVFMGFLEAGIPLGITFSFLITSPLINEYLVILMLGFFGWRITLLYIVSGITIGVTAGLLLGKMRLERHIVEGMVSPEASSNASHYDNVRQRVFFGLGEAQSIVRKLWAWVLLGVGVGAFIHNYVPQAVIQALISRTGFFSVPLAVLFGVPLYGSCAAIVPVAVVLFQKGIPLGTTLSFTMATAALSLPEAVLLRRAIKLPLIALFFAITALGIIITGYVFNMFQALLT
jgi:uncharacterized membrane protein YraQ (UPF0718 family)